MRLTPVTPKSKVLGGEHRGEWAPGRPVPSLEGLQPQLESGGRRDRGQRTGAGGQSRKHLPEPRLRGTQWEVDPWDPTLQRHRVEHTFPTPGVWWEQAGPSKPLFRPGVNPDPSQDQEVRRQQRTHTPQPRPPQSRRERQWGQHRTSGPAGVGRPPHHPTVGLRPDEPPASTARLPAEVLGEPGTREGPRENGQVGQPEGGPLLSCTALECRLGTK